jgi:hypothetical protein
MKYILSLVFIATLASCASATKTYAPDGREAYSLNCSGTARNWGMCHTKAGELCGSKGYDVLVQNGEQGQMIDGSSSGSVSGMNNSIFGSSSSNIFGSSLHFRSMTIACKE